MIKQFGTYAFIFISLLFATSLNGNSLPTSIQQSLQEGNAVSLAKHFGSTVEVTIERKEQICSKMQAEIIMRDFFQKHPPQRVKILHQGGSSSSSYAILQMACNDNTKYRITLLIKNIADEIFIQQLRIEPNDF